MITFPDGPTLKKFFPQEKPVPKPVKLCPFTRYKSILILHNKHYKFGVSLLILCTVLSTMKYWFLLFCKILIIGFKNINYMCSYFTIFITALYFDCFRQPAPYFDPVVKLPFSNVMGYRILRGTYENKLEVLGDKSDPEVAKWLAFRRKQQELRNLVAKRLQQVVVTQFKPASEQAGPSTSALMPTVTRTAGQTILSGAPTRPMQTILIAKP